MWDRMFGTGKRAAITLALMFLAISVVAPDVGRGILARLAYVLGDAPGLVLGIIIALIALKILLRPPCGGGH